MATRREIVWIVVLTTVGGLLRLSFLDAQSLGIDEIGQALVATLPWSQLADGIRSHVAATPLDYLGTRLSMAVISDPTVGPRLWPAVVGTISIPALWLAARAWYRPPIPLLAAAILTVLPLHLYYSGEARFYALSALTTILLIGTFGLAQSRGGRWYVAWAIAITLSLHAHYYSGIIVLVQLGAGLSRGVGDRRLLVAAAAGMLTIVPWTLWALPAQLAAAPRPVGGNALALAELVVPDLAAGLAAGLPPIVPALLIAAYTVAILAGSQRRHWIPIAAVAVIGVGWLGTLGAGYFWAARHAILALPLLVLAAAAGVVRLATYGQMFVTVATICFIGLHVPVLVGTLGTSAWQPREDWRAASRFAEMAAGPDDTIESTVGPEWRYGIAYYAPELLARTRQYPTDPASSTLVVVLTNDLLPPPGTWTRHDFGFHLAIFVREPG